MRKDHIYHLFLSLGLLSSDIISALPHGIITDAARQHSTGLFEVKCPYSKHDNYCPRETCSDSNFFVNQVILKKIMVIAIRYNYSFMLLMTCVIGVIFCIRSKTNIYTKIRHVFK